MVVVKLTFGNDIRRLSFEQGAPPFAEFRVLLKKLFHNSLPSGFVIKYVDDENDLVTISTDRELQEAFAFSEKQKQPLLRFVVVEGKTSPRAKATAEAQPEPSAQAQPQAKPAAAATPEHSATAQPERPAESASASASTAASQTLEFDPAQLVNLVHQALNNPQLNRTYEAVERNVLPFVCSLEQDIVAFVQQLGARTRNSASGCPQLVRIQHLLRERLPQAIQHDVNVLLPELISELQGIFAPLKRGESEETKPAARVAHNAICDNCEKRISGVRYHCTTCPDFDLCEECEAKQGVHDAGHFFLKLRVPLPWGWERRRLIPDISGPRCPAMQPGLDQASWVHRRHHHHHHGGFPHRMRGWHRGAFNAPSSRFVSDVTINDGEKVAAGSEFMKVWRLRNDGNDAWPQGTHLIYISGAALSKVEAVTVPALPPGQEVDIAVNMVAPTEPGRYVSYWRLATPHGYRFGHRIWVDVEVPAAEESPEPAKEEVQPEEEAPEATETTPLLQEEKSSEPEVVTPPTVEIAAAEEPEQQQEESEEEEEEDDGETPELKGILSHLEQMGFANRSLNKELLAKHRNNVIAVVHKLLDM